MKYPSGYGLRETTTKKLLGYWFESDLETSDGMIFTFYPIQRIAIEVLIYIVEILEATGLKGGFLTFNQAMKLGYKIPKGTKTIAKLIRPMLEEVEVNKGKWEVKQSGRLFPVFHKSQLEEKGA